MTSDRPLAPRQRAFVKEWLANGGNGTQAALKTYGCTTDNSAAVCAYRLLRNPKIQEVIRQALVASDLSLQDIVGVLAEGMDATKLAKGTDTGVPDHSTRLRSADMALRLLGAYDTESVASPPQSQQGVVDEPIEVVRFMAAFGRYPTKAERQDLLAGQVVTAKPPGEYG